MEGNGGNGESGVAGEGVELDVSQDVNSYARVGG